MANRLNTENQTEFMRLSERESVNWQMLSLDGDMENQMY